MTAGQTKVATDAYKTRNSIWVSANAGSGKTRNLITRVAQILLNGTPPEKILCLTYTTAAATEMRERLFAELGSWSMKSDKALRETLLFLDKNFFKQKKKPTFLLKNARRLFAKALETPGGLKIQTIHGFCSSILSKFPLEINISPNFKIMDERQKDEFINQALIETLKEQPEAFEDVIKVLKVSDVEHFLDQILVNRSFLEIPFDLEAFCKCFGISNKSCNSNDHVTTIYKKLPENIMTEVSESLLNGSRTDRMQAQHLINIETVENLKKLEMLESFFCTKDGKMRSSRVFPSKKAKSFNPRLEHLFIKLRENYLIYLYRREESNIIKKTEVLYSFSKILLKKYTSIKHSDGFLDYEDLIIKTRDLLLDYDSKWVLYKLDGGIDHILLDEAQDTSIEQWEMLNALMEDFFSDERSLNGERTLYVVGDEKQSIYSFQGADIKSFFLMKEFFTKKLKGQGNELESVELTKSFRSSEAILSFVNEILTDGGGTGVANISSHEAFYKDLPGRVELWPLIIDDKNFDLKTWWNFKREVPQISGVEQLAENIAFEIQKILKSGKKIIDPNIESLNLQRKILPGDFLILVRNRGPIFDKILKKLIDYQLPVAGSDRLLLMDELAVKDLIALLKFLTNNFDDLSLAEALRSPLLGLSEKDLFTIAYDRDCSLFQSLKIHFPKHDACQILESLLADVKQLAPYELLERVLINHNGRLKMTTRLGEGVNDVLDEFLERAITYEELGPPTTFGFLSWLEGVEVAVKRQLENNGSNIRVMTIHGSKGLEAPIVIIPEMVNFSKQSRKRPFLKKGGFVCFWENGEYLPEEIKVLREQKVNDEMDEENRLFYVAVTRAQTWLILCGVTNSLNVENSVDNTWYFKSQKALQRLTEGQLLSVCEGEKIIYEHNWNLCEFEEHKQQESTGFLVSNNTCVTERTYNLLFQKTRIENQPVSPLNVSTLVDELKKRSKSRSIEGIGHTDNLIVQRTLYGAIVHLFLQLLPIHSEGKVAYVKNLVYNKYKHATSDNHLFDTALAESQRILKKPELNSLLRKSTNLREITISGVITVQHKKAFKAKRRVRLRGRIDLLSVTDTKVLIVDFKTSKNVPLSVNEVSHNTLLQLHLYSRILREIYPTKEIQSAILWTKTAELMTIPSRKSCEPYNEIFLNHFLDVSQAGF